MGKNQEAMNDFNECIKLNQNYIMAYCSRGDLCNSIGDSEKVLDDFLKVDELIKNEKNLIKLS